MKSALEDDGFITCHPSIHEGRLDCTGMALDEARGIRADLAHHPDARVIEAARVIVDQSDNAHERETALALLAILEPDNA